MVLGRRGLLAQEVSALSKLRKHRGKLLVLLCLGLGLACFLGIIRPSARYEGLALSPYTVVEHRGLPEPSGLTRGRRGFWTHNDSGNAPQLFALSESGQVQAVYHVEGAELVDWEAITARDGRVLIADLGNNLNLRRDLGLYELSEPDPTASEYEPRTVEARHISVVYPDQSEFPPRQNWDYDCEAIFSLDEDVYLVTKTRPAYRLFVQGNACQLYRLVRSKGSSAALERVDAFEDTGGWVTGADASPSGRLVAVLVESPVQGVWLFERPLEGHRIFSDALAVSRCQLADLGQVEAIAFQDEDTLILMSEEGKMFRLGLDKFEKVSVPLRP